MSFDGALRQAEFSDNCTFGETRRRSFSASDWPAWLVGRACDPPSADHRVITRGTPPRVEGCRPASRGCALELMTCVEL